MQALDFNEKLRNLVIVGLVIAVTLVSAVHENYLVIEKGWAPAFHSMFWFVLLGGFCLLVWLAWSISTRRLVSFVAVIFIIEYINQSLATKLGLWTYSAQGGAYIFGVWAWVVSGLVTYAIASRATVRLTMKGKLSLPRFLNPVVVIMLFLVICFFGRDHLIEAGRQMLQSFLIFYGALMVVGILASLWMDTRALVGVIISALIVGFISESAGATAGIWQFLQPPSPDQVSALAQSSQAIRISPSCPPVYLILGCWPLEILAQFALSALISGEAVVTLPPSQNLLKGLRLATANSMTGFMELMAKKRPPPQNSGKIIAPNRISYMAEAILSRHRHRFRRNARCSRKKILREELTDGERVLCGFMRISALAYFLVGLMFAIWPGMITQIGTDPGVFIRSPTGFPRVLERFWVSMSFSMMMTISFLAFYAQYDIRRNKHFVIPLLIAKASLRDLPRSPFSSLSGRIGCISP